MVVCLSGKHRHVAVGEPKFEYLALIIFAGKNVKQTSATDPKFEYLSLIFLAGKNGQVAVGDPKFELWRELKVGQIWPENSDPTCVFGKICVSRIEIK
jgi:hypothetical protein